MGSAGVKVISVVRDVTDAYVHAGGQYEWDYAAPVAVARAAGLFCSRVDGSELRYNQDDVSLPDLIVCRPGAVRRRSSTSYAGTAPTEPYSRGRVRRYQCRCSCLLIPRHQRGGPPCGTPWWRSPRISPTSCPARDCGHGAPSLPAVLRPLRLQRLAPLGRPARRRTPGRNRPDAASVRWVMLTRRQTLQTLGASGSPPRC